ncbi:MAG: hypothetical protein A3G25_07365 [Betaproteobacteria bacterium RIFCSPLOWO2_12_FULL_63_13]|nr:MAG: hypothetical protein A3G25_07365 [Betaproteobacteria bacterium RIFCSPLOWO2_12_FULL_63_13]
MGLLDDLKKQAELVKTQQISQEALLEENVERVEEKMKRTFQYLNDLLKQLAVLKPVNPRVFSLPGLGDLKNLGFAESFIDWRKKRLNDRDHFDSINFFIRWGSSEVLVIERDMPAAAQKVRDALFGYRLKFEEEEIKGQKGTATKWRFTSQSAVVTDVKIHAEHERGTLFITAKNLERMGIVDAFAVPAQEFDDALLEEFAKTLLGQPGTFRKYRVAPGARPA